jgi:type I restriction enzyme R subunit
VGFIIVNNMLLTGFDAPLEQVMYLDQVIRAHNLLQAIARVNRVHDENKTCGFVVDYVGVGYHLREALADYDERSEIIGALQDDAAVISELVDRHRKLKEFVKGLGITDENDYDAYFDLFYEEDARFEFLLLFREFSRALDAVYPRKEALDFLPDFKHYSEINVMASKHFRDARLSMKGVPEKLRRIADEHLVSKGIEQILREFKDNWKVIRQKLEELRQKIAKAEKEENTYGLHRRKQMPFFRIFRKEIFDGQELNDDQVGQVIDLTKQTTGLLETELLLKGFWDNIPARTSSAPRCKNCSFRPPCSPCTFRRRLPTPVRRNKARG